MLRQSIGVSIEIRRSLAPELWSVLIDTGQIETALLNIAINARDAMPRGGVLLIETANIGSGSDELPEEVASRDCILVSLRDTGTGMTPEVIERAFEPFFTTKEIGKGTGLGLSMVFGVVRQSGGTVRIRSRLREGTTVEVYLPRAMNGPRSARRTSRTCEWSVELESSSSTTTPMSAGSPPRNSAKLATPLPRPIAVAPPWPCLSGMNPAI
jgi:signal transduction histidine kinase